MFSRLTNEGMEICVYMENLTAIIPSLPLTPAPLALGYCRESTKVPIGTQRIAILRFCQIKKLRLLHFHQDAFDTADVPLADRPSGKLMWENLQSGQHLVVYELAFAFSNQQDFLATIRECQARDITLHVVRRVDTAFEPTAFPLEETAKALEAYRTLNRNCQSESTRIALIERRRQGCRYTNFPGYGYRWVRRRGRQIRVPDQDELRVIAWLKKSWLAGQSLDQLYFKLLENRTRTRSGKPWSRSRIYRVLRKVLFIDWP